MHNSSFHPHSQVESRDFLLGFAILQAFPGPNFNFAAYLGVLALPTNPALGAILGWFGIFSPGILLKLSLLPLYSSWRKNQFAKSVLRGLNATAAGLVYTAVWQLFLGESNHLFLSLLAAAILSCELSIVFQLGTTTICTCIYWTNFLSSRLYIHRCFR